MKRRWRDEFDPKAAGVGVLLAVPALVSAWVCQQSLGVYCLLLTVSAAIIVDRLRLNWPAACLLCVAMVGCVEGVWWARTVPGGATVACVVLAAGGLALSAWGSEWRTLGSFLFIPAVYLAFEYGAPTEQARVAQGDLLRAAVIALAVIPGYAAALQYRAQARFDGQWHRPFDVGPRLPVGRSVVAAGLAVGLGASLVQALTIAHGQWLIWSALSIVTWDKASSQRKRRDRLMGMLWGVPVGAAAGVWGPGGLAPVAGFGLLGMLSLTCIPRYSLAYGVRCLAATGALLAAGASLEAPVSRVVNALVGLAIGTVAMWVVHWQWGRGR